MTLSFYTFGTPTAVLSLELDESKSSLIEQLNETTRLAVTLTAPFAPALKVGMYTTYNGSDYYLIAEPSVTKVHSESYIVEADLESVAGLTKATILSNPIDKRTSFDYTATAREHLQLIADSLNQKLTNSGLKWAVGSVNCRNDVRHIKYDHVTTWVALQRIRESYKTDIAINGTTISLGIPSDKANALELSYGKDKGLLSGLERVKHSDTPTPSRLYVTGTKRNLVKGTLTLQPSQVLKIDDTGRVKRITTPGTGRVYTTDRDGRYVELFTTDTTHLRTEATYKNEEIYPSHISKVTTVEKVRDHFEVNCDLDLDYNEQTIAGEQMQIVFQSGNLAGREFDAVFKTSSKRFAITPKEEDETTLPNDILCPKVGDRYIITGIELPQQYIDEAQEKLTDAAVQQLEEMQNTRYSYKAEVDPVYLYNNRTAIADKLTVGKYVHLTDTQIAQGDPYIRITSKRTYLDRIYQPEIELSNEVEEYSFFERLKDSFSEIARIDRKEELARINKQIDVTMPDRIKDKIKGDTELQELIKGRDGKDGAPGRDGADGTDGAPGKDGHTPKLELGSDGYLYIDRVKQSTLLKGRDGKDGAPGKDGVNPKPSDVADLIANSANYKQLITAGLPDEDRIKELALELDNERKIGGRNLITAESCANRTSDDEYRWLFEAEKGTSIKLCNQRDFPTLKAGEEVTLSILIQCDKSDWGGYEWAIRIADAQGTVKYLEPNNVTQDGFNLHKWTFTIREEGRTPLIQLYNHIFRRDDAGNIKYNKRIEAKQIKLERGNVATDWTPAPEDLLGALDSAKLELNQTITDGLSKKADTSAVDGLRDYVVGSHRDISHEFQLLRDKDKSLEAKQMQDDERKWLRGVMRKLIPSDIDQEAFANGSFVAMSSDLALRSSNGAPTAMLGGSSNKQKALLLAGVSEYGTDNQTEQTAIYEDGTAKFGEVSIANDRIELKSKNGEPLALTADDAVFVEDVVARGKINEDSLSISTKAITNSSSGVKLGDFVVANDGTKVTISIGKLTSEVYAIGKSMLLMLDVEVLGSWSGKTELVREDNGGLVTPGTPPSFYVQQTPLVAQNLTWNCYLDKGSHTLLAIIYSGNNTDKGRIEGLNVHQSYDASKLQTLISQSGVRAYGGSARYFDVDARIYVPLAGENVIPNYYTARVKGGMRVDSLTLEQPLDAPGCVLAGGEVDENGSVVKSFGKYKKKQGDSAPRTDFDYNTHYYTIYHSIGNRGYIPIVTSRSSAWADVPRVVSVSSNSFTIAFINEANKVSDWRQPFIYVCYKAD